MTIENYNELLNHFKNYRDDLPIYIWGTGVYGNLIGKNFNDSNIEWKGYIDNYSYVNKTSLNGKPVKSGQNLENAVYIITVRQYNSIIVQLKRKNIPEKNIFYFENAPFFNEVDVYNADLVKYKEKIARCQGVHKGEKCFLIGNGPSLTLEDLEGIKAKGYCTFASNMIFKCFDKTSFRPDYYFVMDANLINNHFNNENSVRYLFDQCDKVFSRVSSGFIDYYDKYDNLCLYNALYCPTDTMLFSSECSENVYIGYTVTYEMMQMAVYMGFKEIYLIGMDHRYSHEMHNDGTITINDVKDHSSVVDEHKSLYYSIDKTTAAFKAAKKYAEQNDIKIMNATRGGYLEVYDRINCDSLL